MKMKHVIGWLGAVLLMTLATGSRAWAAFVPVAVSPQLPVIPSAVFNVTNYGAISDGITTNTTAINAAIMDACVTNAGGTVELPYVAGSSNVYLSGPIGVRSFLNLQIDAGVTLRALPYGSYSGGDFVADTTGSHAYHDIEISGGGTVDGQATLAGWWSVSGTSGKPYLMNFYHVAQLLVTNITLMRAPIMHLKINGSSSQNVTVQNVTINTDSSDSHNTDGIDMAGNNILVRDCSISCGDDNIAITANGSNIVITNCAFGTGHGMSIGGSTSPGGVSNLLVINCSFNGTDNGIRIKSDNNLNGNVGGGPCQNLQYVNLKMTNVNNTAVTIYSYYNETGSLTGITPTTAAGEPVALVSSTPSYQNVLISNLTATVAGSGIAGIIWGRTELPYTNIILSHVNITASKGFDVYNAYQVQLVDSKILPTSSSQPTFTIWNAGLVVTNDALGTNSVAISGATSTNQNLELDNVLASLTGTNLFGASPLTLNGGTVTNTGTLILTNTSIQNFYLGANTGSVKVAGSLALNGTINVMATSGFAPGTYRLFTYTGSLGGTPSLGVTPAGYLCTLDTKTAGQVNFNVTAILPPAPPVIGSITPLNDGNGSMVISGSGGVTNGTYYVLETTNLALPFSQWMPAATNPFDALGNFSFTNSPGVNVPQMFYILQVP